MFTETPNFIFPNVSHCIAENDVHYNPLPPCVTLEITVPNDNTKVWFYSTANGNINSIEVNGVKRTMTESFQALEYATFYGTKLDAGNYTVKYYLNDETYLGAMGGYSYASGGGTYICYLTNTITVPDTVKYLADYAISNWYDGAILNIDYFKLEEVGTNAFGCPFFSLPQETKDYVTSVCPSGSPAYCK